MTNTENKEQSEEKNKKTDILERLEHGAIDGLAVQVAMDTILPGTGAALNGLDQMQQVKEAAKIMGKGAAQEGIQMLGEENEEEQDPVEHFKEGIAQELLGRIRWRG